jgi:hypothetical protein
LKNPVLFTIFVVFIISLFIPINAYANNSFVAGTVVLTPKGPRNIETLKAGEKVLSYDTKSMSLKEGVILKTSATSANRIFAVTANGISVRITGEHAFFVKGKKWVKVKYLKEKLNLRTMDGKSAPITDVRSVALNVKVYNIMVKKYQTYFVTSSGFLVRN